MCDIIFVFHRERKKKGMLDILIVEDNKEIGTLLCDFLRRENYMVSVAETGEKAMELYEKYGARVVVLDIYISTRYHPNPHAVCFDYPRFAS